MRLTTACFFFAPSLALANVGPDAKTNDRIMGGEAAQVCEWPSTIGFGGCTGTLVHPQVVILAAHCGPQAEVQFGEAYTSMARTVATKYCKVNSEWMGESESLGQGVDFAFCVLDEPVTDVPFVPIILRV